MRDKLIDEMVRRPVRLLAIAAAITIFAGVLGGPVQNLLVPSRADFGDPTAESGHVEASLKSVLSTGAPGGVVALVRTHGDIRRDRSSQRAVARAATRLEDDPALPSVTSPDEQRGMISRGGHSASLVATMKGMPDAGIQDA